MVEWFAKHAPIRLKFGMLVTLHAILGVGSITAAVVAGNSVAGANVAVPIGIAATCAIGAVLVTWLARQMICGPYVDTVLRMEALAEGDLVSPIRHTENQDCVGRMARAMAVLRRSTEEARGASDLREVAAVLATGLERLAQGDLRQRIDRPFPAEFEALRSDYNRAMAAMVEMLALVSHAAQGLKVGAGDIGGGSANLLRGIELQATDGKEAAAAIDQIFATTREITGGATLANTLVAEARLNAEQSGEVARHAVAAMGGIRRSFSELSEIVAAIEDAGFQTNLAAFNAGAEAARADDVGRGIAVAAFEIRALARHSAEASKDVKSRILASSERVDAGVELVIETGKALERITDRIGKISGLVSPLAASAEQQTIDMRRLNSTIAGIGGVTQQNAALATETTAVARRLSEEACTLAQEVARFKIDVVATSAPTPRHAVSAVHKLQERVRTGRPASRPARGRGVSAARREEDWSAF